MSAPVALTPLPGDVSSEALLHSVLNVSLTGFILFRPAYNDAADTILDFTYDYLNPAAQQMLRLPQRPAESFLTLYPMAEPAGIFAFYRQAFLSGQTQRQEFNYQYDGLDGYFHLAAQRQGPVLIVSFTDTNDQARTAVEQALRESQAREQAALTEVVRQRGELTRVFELAPVAIAVYQGPEHRIELANPVSCQLLNRSADELLGKPLFEALPELAGHGFEQVLASVYTTGQPVRVQERPGTHAREGRLDTLYWNLAFLPMRAADGRITGALSVGIEVSEQVLARQRMQDLNEDLAALNEKLATSNQEYQEANAVLHKTQQQLQQLTQELEARVQLRTREVQRLFEQAPMAIVVLRGPRFIIEQANEHAEAIWGRTAAEVLGRPHFEALPDSGGQGFEQMLMGILHSGEPVILYEMPIALKRAHTGRPDTGYYNIIFKPLHDDDQHVSSIVVMWTEQTDQVLARKQVHGLNEELATINEELTATNEELHQSNTQLTRTNADLDTFVYTASHDLKAPITNIEGLLNALRDHLPAEVQSEEVNSQLLSMMQGAVERFQYTINQLTDVSRLQQAQNQPAEQVQLATIVEDVRLDLLPLLASTKGQLTVEIGSEIHVHFSPKNLRSVVYNLLSNALKYHQPYQPPAVLLRAINMGGQVVLTVTDNGLGMSGQQQRQLFGLFQRLHTHVEGTGVGLYMVKRIIDNAGGTITVHSQPGKGTMFTVTFPASSTR